MEAVLRYAEFIAWNTVNDQRASAALQIFQNVVQATVGTTEKPE